MDIITAKKYFHHILDHMNSDSQKYTQSISTDDEINQIKSKIDYLHSKINTQQSQNTQNTNDIKSTLASTTVAKSDALAQNEEKQTKYQSLNNIQDKMDILHQTIQKAKIAESKKNNQQDETEPHFLSSKETISQNTIDDKFKKVISQLESIKPVTQEEKNENNAQNNNANLPKQQNITQPLKNNDHAQKKVLSTKEIDSQLEMLLNEIEKIKPNDETSIKMILELDQIITDIAEQILVLKQTKINSPTTHQNNPIKTQKVTAQSNQKQSLILEKKQTIRQPEIQINYKELIAQLNRLQNELNKTGVTSIEDQKKAQAIQQKIAALEQKAKLIKK